ncbi:MAG: hypothetical protein KF824_03980 [Fimbriimonadaceae bacterium]|nr:MAG: hypothetical protein KF824_03980 [Fimbriimonadaceae bacterium]
MTKYVNKQGLFAFILIIFLMILAGIAIPVFLGSKPAPKKTQSLSNHKQVATSLLIYSADNEGTYPNGSGMPTIRVQLTPFTKRKELFIPHKNYTTTPYFNFNLAGVKDTLPPYPGTEQREPAEVAMWYSHILAKPYGFIVAHADSSVKFYSAAKHGEYRNLLVPQFDRKGVQLLPPDYHADQDPLKESE